MMYKSPWHSIYKITVYNTGPYHLQQPIRITIQVYGLQFELKATAGRVRQEQAKQSTNTTANIRQGIGHSSLKT